MKITKLVIVLLLLSLILVIGGLLLLQHQINASDDTGTIQTPSSEQSPTTTPDRQMLISALEATINNPDCQLPCFLEIIPGRTKDADIMPLLNQNPLMAGWNGPDNLDNSQGLVGGSIYLDLTGSGVDIFRLSILAENSKVKSMELFLMVPNQWLSFEAWTVKAFLARYSEIPVIFIARSASHLFHLIFVYEEEGLVFDYAFDIYADGHNQNRQNRDPIEFCPTMGNTRLINIQVEDPTDSIRTGDNIYKAYDFDHAHKLDEVLAIDAQEFTEFFRAYPDECLDLQWRKPTPDITATPDTQKIISDIETAINDPKCQLPCFLGITPGITRDIDIVPKLSENPLFINWDGPESLDSSQQAIAGTLYINLAEGQTGSMNMTVVSENRVLKSVELLLRDPNQWLSFERWSLNGFLSNYPSAPVIFIGDSASHQFNLLFIYDAEGIALSYEFDIYASGLNQDRQGRDPIQFCPTLENTTLVIIQIESTTDSLQTGDNIYKLYEGGYVHKLDEVFAIDAQEFTDFFRANPDECLTLKYLPLNSSN